MVTVLLEPREDGQTLMTIRHALLPPGLADEHERGWEAIAGQLAAKLSAGQATVSASALTIESIRPGKRRSRSSLRSDM